MENEYSTGHMCDWQEYDKSHSITPCVYFLKRKYEVRNNV